MSILFYLLIMINNLSIFAKFKLMLIISMLGAPIGFFGFVREWIDTNGGYVGFVLVAIGIDHLLGTIVHAFYKRDFSPKKNIVGLLIKLFLIFSIGVLFEGFQVIYSKQNFITEYLTLTTRLMVFLYPAGSAFMNCSIITNGKFPPIGWIDKIGKFNKNLDVSEFKTKNNNYFTNEDNINETKDEYN